MATKPDATAEGEQAASLKCYKLRFIATIVTAKYYFNVCTHAFVFAEIQTLQSIIPELIGSVHPIKIVYSINLLIVYCMDQVLSTKRPLQTNGYGIFYYSA